MARENELPLPKLDALLLGAHRSVGAPAGDAAAASAPAPAPAGDAAAALAPAWEDESQDAPATHFQDRRSGGNEVAENESEVRPATHPSGCADVGIPVLTDERLFAATGVRIAFTSRAGGVSEGPCASLNCALHVNDDERSVLRNRQIVLEALGAPQARIVSPSQVHGTHVVCVRRASKPDRGTVPLSGSGEKPDRETVPLSGSITAAVSAAQEEVAAGADAEKPDRGTVPLSGFEVSTAQEEAAAGADAVVVQMEGVAALLNFADCLPLIIVAPDGSFAVAHAGWRGAVARIASKAARTLADVSSCTSSQFNAYIGPHIREECFEVGNDVRDAFAEEFGPDVLVGERHVSLAAAVTRDLEDAGLLAERIADSVICTKCHPDQYFSYRATNGACGRHSAVAIRL